MLPGTTSYLLNFTCTNKKRCNKENRSLKSNTRFLANLLLGEENHAYLMELMVFKHDVRRDSIVLELCGGNSCTNRIKSVRKLKVSLIPFTIQMKL